MNVHSTVTLGMNRISRQSVFLIVGVFCLVFLTSTSFVKSWRMSPLATAEKGNQPMRTPTVVSNLTRFGFEPSLIKIPAGRCFVAIRNLVGKEQLDLQIKRSGGGTVLFADRQIKGKSHWEKSLEFGVGDYVITEAGNPGWALQLSVVPPSGQ